MPTDAQLEDFEERAAILEYCAGYKRGNAEAKAWAMVIEDSVITSGYIRDNGNMSLQKRGRT